MTDQMKTDLVLMHRDAEERYQRHLVSTSSPATIAAANGEAYGLARALSLLTGEPVERLRAAALAGVHSPAESVAGS